jgi:hypothetical protein
VDETSALRAIRSLVANTAYHASGFESLRHVNDWLTSGQDRIRADGQSIKVLLRTAIDFLSDDVLPALEGLSWWAESRYNQSAKSDLDNARARLISNLIHLGQHADGLHKGEIGAEAVESIETIWRGVTKNSLNRRSDLILSEPFDPDSGALPVIERWMPEFFSLPYEIACGLSDINHMEDQIVFATDTPQPTLAVVPVAARTVRRMYDLFLSDMRKHGQAGTYRVTLSPVDREDRMVLIAQFENRVNEKGRKGAGRSQEEITSIASQPNVRVEVTFDRPQRPGKPYKSKMVFPIAIYVQWRS